jgi:Zn-dependent protease/predicted transcriptional regulator
MSAAPIDMPCPLDTRGSQSMKWSFKIGQFRNIGVYVHATFFLLLIFIAASHWNATQDAMDALRAVGFVLALFLCVLLHEFGHALTAAYYGIRTRDITLLPIGGVARLERMPDEPIQELWVAIAGPMVNVVIAGLLGLWLVLTQTLAPLQELSVTGGPFLERLMIVNIFLVLFNLLPAFPMDGGRVLRALLAIVMDYSRATQIAAGVGQAMALLFGLLGILSGNWFLVFIALFVWIGASSESSVAQLKAAIGGIPVTRAMMTQFQVLHPDHPISHVVSLVMAGAQHDFPVVENDQVIGVLSRQNLLTGLTQHGSESLVRQAMDTGFATAEANEMLETAFARLQECQCTTLPVLSRGQLVGLLTLDNVGEFLAIQTALGGRR